MSFGWTVKIVEPVWIHVGPGFTGKIYYGTYLSKHFPKKGFGETELLDLGKMGLDKNPNLTKEEIELSTKDDLVDAWRKANYALAVSPVIGITAKYSYFVFRLTYQYRWSIESKLSDFIGNNRLSIGVGVAF